MERSEQIEGLATALAKAQGVMQPAIKDAENPHFKSRYADLASVWEACRAPLSANGLSVVQIPSVTALEVSITTVLLHTTGQWISSRVTALVGRADPQGVGSAITYLRRYALAAMVGIAPAEDDGEMASSHQQAPQQRQRAERQQGRQQSAPAAQRGPAPSQERQERVDPPKQQQAGPEPRTAAQEKQGPNLEAALRQIDGCKTKDECNAVVNVLRPLKWTPAERKVIAGAAGAKLKALEAALVGKPKGVFSCEHCGTKDEAKHTPGCPGMPDRAPLPEQQREAGSDDD